MKNLFKLTAAVAAFAFVFTSCSDDEETSSEVTVSTTGTISGVVTAPSADTAGAPSQPVGGVQVHARISIADVAANYDSTYDYENEIYSATTDNSGEYSIEVKAGSKPVNVEVYGDDFREDYWEAADSAFSTKVFSLSPDTIVVSKDQNYIHDFEAMLK